MGTSVFTMLRSMSSRFPAGVRSLATKAKKAAAEPAKVEVPIRLHGLDGRYATSLYSVATRKGGVDAVEKDLGLMTAALASGSQGISELLHNPSIPKQDKVAAIEALNAKSGFNDSTKNLLALLADNNRLSELENITEKSLGSFITKGQTLTMSVQTDSSILGGLVVEIGDKHVDLSIISRITKLQNELKGAI